MNTLEDEIAALLKAAPGDPPATLDADDLLATRPRRRGVLAPLLVAAAVAAIGITVAVAAGFDDHSPTPGIETGSARPAWSFVRGVTTVDVTVIRRMPLKMPPVRRTLTGAPARRLAALVNALPARPLTSSMCPGIPPDTWDRLVFRTDSGVLTVSGFSCARQATITESGRPTDEVFIDGPTVDAALLRALGLPPRYGSVPSTMARRAAEAFARRAIHAPRSAPTFSRFMTVAQFEQAYDDSVTGLGGPHQIWVVTVHAPVTDDGGPAAPPKQHQVVSIVIDPDTGLGTTSCAGCDWVQADQ